MLKEKSQLYNFGHEALPTLFHTQTKDFFTYLEQDGLKFLKFWWDHVGERLDDSKLVPFEGMKFEIREIPERKARVVLIRFPRPKDYDEFYMAALYKKPEVRSPFIYVHFSSTRMFSLSKVPLEKSKTGTLIYEITPRARYVLAGPGTEVSKEAFYRATYKMVWKK
jgi:hypothetical protein